MWLPARVVAVAIGHVPKPGRLKGGTPVAARRCPDDGTTLYALHAHGVEVDVCRHCGGVWLDDGELDRIAALRRDDGAGGGFDVDANAAGDILEVAGEAVGSVLEFVGEALSGLL